MAGFEPATSSLPRKCSTPELHRQIRAEDEAQTRDPQLGRLMLYQLSYFRIMLRCRQRHAHFCGRRWIRTTEGKNQQIYSLPHLATLVFALDLWMQRYVLSLNLANYHQVIFSSSIPAGQSHRICRVSLLSFAPDGNRPEPRLGL